MCDGDPNQTEQGHTSHNADQTHRDNLTQVSNFFCRCIYPYDIILACDLFLIDRVMVSSADVQFYHL
jgi:hypothetical protein